jgi:hypothetical protein
MSSEPPSIPPLPPAPQLNYASPTVRNDLREIAVRQRAIMLCILGYVVLVILQFALPSELRFILALGAAAVGITGAVFVFMLALAMYNTAAGIILGILTLVPLIGLFVLLIINGKATTILRNHGIKVGLMGADMSQVPTAGPPL